MHMSDALVSPAVAVGAGIAAAALIVAASRKVKTQSNPELIPTMGVMGAFVFAAQMINFTIPGTGSSGHIIGGVLLSAMLGPWAAFLTLCSVIIVQCLVFADGGLMALGCNILNMAVTSCLIAYPLVFKPKMGRELAVGNVQRWRLMLASVLASIVALEIGALGVTAETELSGVTSIPTVTFLGFMLPIHVAIGAVEGVATGVVLMFVARYQPSAFYRRQLPSVAYQTPKATEVRAERKGHRRMLIIFGVAALILAAGFTWLASSNPDGLEWSLDKISFISSLSSVASSAALMPEYNSTFAGIVGSLIVMIMLWAFTSLITARLHKEKKNA